MMVYQTRITKLAKAMGLQGIWTVAISAGPILEYFSGLCFHVSERPAVLIVNADESQALIFPKFEQEKAEQAFVKMQLFPYEEDPHSMIQAFQDALHHLKVDHPIGIDPQSFRFLEIDYMQQARKKTIFVSAADLFEQIFICKDEDEIDAIKKAVVIAESALKKTLENFSENISEKDLANRLVINLLSYGSDPLIPFAPIIASGPNSANPHAIASERQIKKGDLLIIDWGARFNGYVSDITRTFAVGQVESKLLEIAKIVMEANQLARDAIKAGVKASEIDAAARNHISKNGYGDNFLHRTGHGIGLKEHEAPFISQASKTTIQNGMSFTIEPGIYIAGLGGVRIEDDVVATGPGVKTLTTLTREIIHF